MQILYILYMWYMTILNKTESKSLFSLFSKLKIFSWLFEKEKKNNHGQEEICTFIVYIYKRMNFTTSVEIKYFFKVYFLTTNF